MTADHTKTDTGAGQDSEHCPFCDADGTLLEATGPRGKRRIACIGCDAMGPPARTTALAWAEWMRRKGSGHE